MSVHFSNFIFEKKELVAKFPPYVLLLMERKDKLRRVSYYFPEALRLKNPQDSLQHSFITKICI